MRLIRVRMQQNRRCDISSLLGQTNDDDDEDDDEDDDDYSPSSHYFSF